MPPFAGVVPTVPSFVGVVPAVPPFAGVVPAVSPVLGVAGFTDPPVVGCVGVGVFSVEFSLITAITDLASSPALAVISYAKEAPCCNFPY